MAFYNKKEQLYWETDALGVSLRASILHARDGVWFPRNELPNNAALQPIAFLRKNMPSVEMHYGNIERGNPRHTPWPRKILPLLFTHKISMTRDCKLLVVISKKDIQTYHTGYEEYCYSFISTAYESCTILDHSYS